MSLATKVNLEKLADIQSGFAFRSKEYTEAGHFLMRIGNVQDDEISLDKPKFVKLDQKTKKFALRAGDFVTSLTGYIGRVATIEDAHLPAALNQRVARMRVKSDAVLPDYLRYFFQTKAFRAPLEEKAHGAAQANVSPKELAKIPVPLPPLEEQKRIVAVLDQAFAALDRARANAEANLTDAQEFFPSAIAQIFGNIEGCVSRRIGEVAEVYDGPHATPKTVQQGPLFLGISSLVDGRIELEKTRHVTEEDFVKWTRRVVPRAGDVVFSYETRLGQVGLIPEGMKCCLGRRMGLVRLDTSTVSPEYFTAYYLSPFFQSYLKEKTVLGTTVDRISIKEFPSFPVLIPSKETQAEVVALIERIRSRHDAMMETVTAKLSDLEDLRQSILQKAFAGELT